MNGRRRLTPRAWSRLCVLSAAVLLLVAACGGGTATRPSPSPTGTPVPAPPEALFVALQASNGKTWTTEDIVAIVGRDGHVYAHASFQPRPIPWILPDLGPLLPPIAHVATGRAYFMDGAGFVRSLGWTGDVREETRFPITGGQQEGSFAVSPDGRTLVGSVVTFPPRSNPVPSPPYTPTEAYSMDVMVATAGAAATVVYHEEWRYGSPMGSGAQLVAWDVGGPVAVYPAGLGTQGGAPHQYNGPALVHFPGGKPGAAVPAPYQTAIQDLLSDGTYVTATPAGLQVRRSDGSVVWGRPNPSPQSADYLFTFLAPDGQHVVTLSPDADEVLGRDGSTTPLTGLTHSGWLDARTVIGTIEGRGQTRLGSISLSDVGKVVDIGFDGYFVASLS